MAPEPDDVTLMLRYRAGDVAAFEALYGRHKAPLYRYFLRQCRNADTAAELFQEVWTRIIRARANYRPAARFNTYMYQIAHNCLVDQFRREQRRQEEVPVDPFDPDQGPADAGPGPEAAAISQETAQRFRQALGNLPAEQREALLLREEAGLTLEAIAEVTGANAETVKSRLRYAVKKLRLALSADRNGS